MRIWIVSFLAIMLSTPATRRTATDWNNLVDDFVRDYRSLDIQRLRIAYLDNLQGIQNVEGVARQARVLREWEARLARVDREGLTAEQQWAFDLLTYQINLDRSLAFYVDLLGFEVTARYGDEAVLFRQVGITTILV
jgi:hypothetical protein